jgi:excisionase family DNA binding protein
MRGLNVNVNTNQQWYSLQEAADYLGLDEKTLRRYVKTGILTGYRLGPRAIRVSVAEVEALLRPMTPESA